MFVYVLSIRSCDHNFERLCCTPQIYILFPGCWHWSRSSVLVSMTLPCFLTSTRTPSLESKAAKRLLMRMKQSANNREEDLPSCNSTRDPGQAHQLGNSQGPQSSTWDLLYYLILKPCHEKVPCASTSWNSLFHICAYIIHIRKWMLNMWRRKGPTSRLIRPGI